MRRQTIHVKAYVRTGPYSRKCRACGYEIFNCDQFIMEKEEHDDGLEMWYLHDNDMCAGPDRKDKIAASLEADYAERR